MQTRSATTQKVSRGEAFIVSHNIDQLVRAVQRLLDEDMNKETAGYETADTDETVDDTPAPLFTDYQAAMCLMQMASSNEIIVLR